MLEVNEINLLEGLNVIEKIYLNINEKEITRNNSFKNVGNVREIPEFPHYYISDEGKIYSTKRGKTREIKAFEVGEGYLQVSLKKDGKRYFKYVHRLVLETFYPIPEMQSYDCNHINEIKTDNRLCNLNWMTRKDNCNWGTRNERLGKSLSKTKKGKKPSQQCREALIKACSKRVLQYDQNYNLINSYSSAKEAGKALGIAHCTVCNYCRNLKLFRNSFYLQYEN